MHHVVQLSVPRDDIFDVTCLTLNTVQLQCDHKIFFSSLFTVNTAR